MTLKIRSTIEDWIKFGDKMTKKELLSFSGSDCNSHENLKHFVVFVNNLEESPNGFSGVFELSVQYQTKYDYNTYEQMCFDAIKEMNVEGKSDYDKAYALCAWVNRHIKSNGNGAQSGMNGMINQEGVCNAYAELSCYLGRCLGLDILYESGDVWIDSHAWNLVKVDDEWYYMDSTWGTDILGSFLQGNDWLKCNIESVDDRYKSYKELYKIPDTGYLSSHSECHGEHNWIEGQIWDTTHNRKDSTCELPYTMNFRCTKCNAYKWEYYKDPKGHTEGEVVRVDREATCTTTGSEIVHCTTCGKDYRKTIPMVPHNYVNGECTVCHDPCTHDYGDWEITLAPSCSNGKRQRTCKVCGYVDTETIPATHDFQWVSTQDPTCLNAGKKQLKCSKCGKTKGYMERVEPLGHDFKTVRTIPATCKSKAKEEQKCSRCPVSQTITLEDSHYADHTWVEVVKDKTTKCSVCGATHTHRWEEDTALAKSPTCTEPGEKHYVCTADYKDFDQEIHKCNFTKTETIPATGHKWENGKCTVCGITHEHDWEETLTQEPTCTAEGKKVYTCTICKETKEETLPKAEHKWTYTKPASGESQCICTVCETTKPHDLKLLSTDAPTCTTPGYLHYQCNDCGRKVKKTDKANPALGHDWFNESGKCTRCDAEHTHEFTEEITKEPTCKDTGEKTLTCKKCNWQKSETIPKTDNHNWGEWKETLAPTCTETGERTRTCKVCGIANSETVKAKGHSPEKEADTPATCDKAGKEGDTVCSVCHKTLKVGDIIPATGKHDWEETITKQPTCNTVGEKERVCKTCGKKEVESIPATGNHDWDAGTLAQAPTCTEEGKKIFTCQTCGTTKTEVVKAKGHSPEKEADTPATCDKAGKESNTICSVCHEIIKTGKTIPATGHSWDSGKITLAPTYTSVGEKTFTCKKCGEKKSQTIPKLALPAVGTKFSISGSTYTVTKAGSEVSFSQANTKAKSINVPNTVTVSGITYKITGIKANAFKNCKKLTTVTIGTNIRSIASKAFNNCPKLKKVTIKTVLLTKKTASKKAFNKVNKKVILKVPAKAKKSYKKIFKGLKVK